MKDAHVIELILTAQSPIVHGDPAVQRDTNILSFNRQKQILPITRPMSSESNDSALLLAIAEEHTVTPSIKKLFAQSSTAEVIGIILIRMFIKIYSGKGLFTDIDRYSMLDGRVKAVAMKSGTLSGFWGGLLSAMKVDIHPSAYDEPLGDIFTLSQKLQTLTLSYLIENSNVSIFKARLWNNAMKEVARGEECEIELDRQLLLDDPDIKGGHNKGESVMEALNLLAMLGDQSEERHESTSSVVEVPTVSANTIRNRLIRAPGWEHLCQFLNIDAGHPGDGELPLGVEALFVNGGNIESGAKQPNNPEAMANAIRRKYPLVDLLGGVINAVILGRSCLSVNSWLICRENAAILKDTTAEGRPNMDISSFQMVDSEMKIRMATAHRVGQSMANAETLAIGSEILVKLTLAPFTDKLTAGALFAALNTFQRLPFIGGHASTGGGLMKLDITAGGDAAPSLMANYEDYLRDNKETLREGLLKGTMCIGDKALCS